MGTVRGLDRIACLLMILTPAPESTRNRCLGSPLGPSRIVGKSPVVALIRIRLLLSLCSLGAVVCFADQVFENFYID